MTSLEAVIELDGVDVVYDSARGRHHAVRDFSLTLHAGDSVGLVGESGSGKSTVLRAMTRLLPSAATVSGRVTFRGTSIEDYDERQMTEVRGGGIGLVFQDPVNTLNPSIRVGKQLQRIIRLHRPEIGRSDRAAEVASLLKRVGIDPGKARNFPFEFSQGQLQRIMIAASCVAGKPVLVLADEPTTSLDVTIEAQIVQLLRELQESFDLTVLLVTHDLALVSEMCERVVVMYAGTVVEELPTQMLLSGAQHPYTRLLVGSLPPFPSTGERLSTIPMSLRDTSTSTGCVFASRCPIHIGDICDVLAPEIVGTGSADSAPQSVRCHLYGSDS